MKKRHGWREGARRRDSGSALMNRREEPNENFSDELDEIFPPYFSHSAWQWGTTISRNTFARSDLLYLFYFSFAAPFRGEWLGGADTISVESRRISAGG